MPETIGPEGDPNLYLYGAGLMPKPASSLSSPEAIAQKRIDLSRQQEGIEDQELANMGALREREVALSRQKTTIPSDPHFQALPHAPKQDFTDPIKAFQNPAVLVATLGSLLTRAPLTTALKAGAGAMEAYHKGEAEQFALKRDEFKDALDEAIKQNALEMEKYNVAWKKSDAAVKDRMAELQAIASGYKHEVLMAAIKSGRIERIDAILDKLQQGEEKMREASAKVQNQMDVFEQKERLKQKLSEGIVDDETRDFMARQLISGNANVLVGLFRTQGAKLAIEKEARKILETEKGLTSDQAAKYVTEQSNKYMGERRYQATAGGYAARVEAATNEVEQLLPQAIETSKALPRGKFVPLNRLIQAFQAGTSDPAYNDFVFANYSLMNAYARAMNPTGVPHVNDKLEAKAQSILSTATSPEAYEVQARRLWLEVQASKKAIALSREGSTTAKPYPGDTEEGWGELKVKE